MNRLLLALALFAGLSSHAQAQATVPAQAVAPWPVVHYRNALSFASRSNIETVYGAYNERSETMFEPENNYQSQELGTISAGGYVAFAGLDFGTGTDRLMLRISLPSGSATLEARLGSSTGTLVGSCSLPTTGGNEVYKVVGCTTDPKLLKGANKTLVLKFPTSDAGLRLNWFAYWASGTTVSIDDIQKTSTLRVGSSNVYVPNLSRAGTPVRTRSMQPAAGEVLAKTFGAYSLNRVGECPKWLHDTYWIKSPEDGKIYPTWHPPVDYNTETGKYCTYRHEHGDDPRASNVFALGGMPPFGFVNEQHEPNNPALRRTEDHFGHKVRIVNGMTLYDYNGSGYKNCDIVLKLHMGTHSMDAFTNTQHESLAYGSCDGGNITFDQKFFAGFGQAGFYKQPESPGCSQFLNSGIAPFPVGQPNSGIHRAIPSTECFTTGTTQEQVDNVYNRMLEFWLGDVTGTSVYIIVEEPTRYFNPTQVYKNGRMANLCYVSGHPVTTTLECQLNIAAAQPGKRLEWNDPRSFFRGSRQGGTHIAGVKFPNAFPASTMYTNVFHGQAQTTPDPTNGIVIKQKLPTVVFDYRVTAGASIFPPTDYSAVGKNGVRGPN